MYLSGKIPARHSQKRDIDKSDNFHRNCANRIVKMQVRNTRGKSVPKLSVARYDQLYTLSPHAACYMRHVLS